MSPSSLSTSEKKTGTDAKELGLSGQNERCFFVLNKKFAYQTRTGLLDGFFKSVRKNGEKTVKKFIGLFFLMIILFSVFCSTAFAQRGPIPSYRFYRGYNYIADGDIANALRLYQDELKNATRIGTSLWLDSICYYAMIGECQYQLGENAAALDAFNSAINIWAAYSNWLGQVEYVTGVGRTPAPGSPWGKGGRIAPLGVFPKNAQIQIGQVYTDQSQVQGVINQAKRISIQPVEIVRCMSLALMRRTEIMGPLAPFDPRAEEIAEMFAKRTVPPNHWSIAWEDVLYGLALNALGKAQEAISVLNDGLLMMGSFDHPLTPIALLSMGNIALEGNQPKEALVFFYEATVSAFYYDDVVVMEEAFHQLAAVQKIVNPGKPCDPALAALNWFKNRKYSRFLKISLCEEVAENLIEQGNFQEAGNTLKTIDILLGRTPIRNGRLGARWNYLSALLAYADGNIPAGDLNRQIVLDYMKKSSLWLYQLSCLTALFQTNQITTNGNITPRNAADLYEYLLREPFDADWKVRPMEAMAVQELVSSLHYEQWFVLLTSRSDKFKALEVAERAKRQRFFSNMYFGNRLISLRYLLESSEAALPERFRVHRQNVLVKFPQYSTLSKKVRDLKLRLHSLDLIPKTEDQKAAQQKLLADLAAVSAKEEAMLRYMALSRIRYPLVFPNFLSTKELQSELSEKTSILYFFEALGDTYGFMITNQNLDFWKVGSTGLIGSSVAKFLRSLLTTDSNRVVTAADLAGKTGKKGENDWRKLGGTLLPLLLGNPTAADARANVTFSDLVIVPEKGLWYLPFEALCVPSGKSGKQVPLIEIPGLTVRYAPTAGMSVSSKRGRSALGETVVVKGKLYPQQKDEEADAALLRLSKNVQRMTLFPTYSLNVPSSIIAPRINQLVVLSETPISKTGALNWIPFPSNRQPASNELASWLELPWGAPKLVILPGFRTPAENALKSSGNGNELFYSALAFQANGTETVLLSRWKTAGRTTYDLVGGFLEKYPTEMSGKAWKESVAKIRETPLIAEEEPRVNSNFGKLDPPLGEHPFFWAGYLLLDNGEDPTDKPENALETQDDLNQELAPEFNPDQVGEDVKNLDPDQMDEAAEDDPNAVQNNPLPPGRRKSQQRPSNPNLPGSNPADPNQADPNQAGSNDDEYDPEKDIQTQQGSGSGSEEDETEGKIEINLSQISTLADEDVSEIGNLDDDQWEKLELDSEKFGESEDRSDESVNAEKLSEKAEENSVDGNNKTDPSDSADPSSSNQNDKTGNKPNNQNPETPVAGTVGKTTGTKNSGTEKTKTTGKTPSTPSRRPSGPVTDEQIENDDAEAEDFFDPDN